MGLFSSILNKAGFVTSRDLKRAVRYAEKRGFKAAQINRLTSDFLGTSQSINRELRSDMVKVRGRGRELWRNDDYLQSYRHSLKANVPGHQGFILQSKVLNADGTEDRIANMEIERKFKKWCRKEYCTMSGMFNFTTVQHLAAIYPERDGEFICRIVRNIDEKINPFGVSLELIEPDYLDETYNDELPNGNVVVMGVEINEWKRPVAFHFKKRESKFELTGSWIPAGRNNTERVLAEDIVFVFDPDHVNQLRGISGLASTLITHHHLNGYIEGHVVAARAGANKMLTIESDVDAEDDEVVGDEKDEKGNQLEYMAPGVTQYLRPGEKANMLDPSYPQGEFWSFVKAMLRKIFSGRGIDYNSASGDLEGVSYSAMRSGKENERNNWMIKQQMLLDYFVIPVFEAVLKSGMMYGEIKLPYSKFEKFNQPTFIPKRWPYFDPVKDVTASILAINNGLSTRGRELGKVGEDYPETIKTLSEEMKEAEKLNIKFGAPKDGLEFIKETDESDSGKEDNDEESESGSGNDKRRKQNGRVLSII